MLKHAFLLQQVLLHQLLFFFRHADSQAVCSTHLVENACKNGGGYTCVWWESRFRTCLCNYDKGTLDMVLLVPANGEMLESDWEVVRDHICLWTAEPLFYGNSESRFAVIAYNSYAHVLSTFDDINGSYFDEDSGQFLVDDYCNKFIPTQLSSITNSHITGEAGSNLLSAIEAAQDMFDTQGTLSRIDVMYAVSNYKWLYNNQTCNKKEQLDAGMCLQ